MSSDSSDKKPVATAVPRFDMYTDIHKAMRAMMADTLLAVGRMDHEDEQEVASVCQRVQTLLNFCEGHLKHENEFVHPAIEARASGASDMIAHDHEEHKQHIARLTNLCDALLKSPQAAREAAALELYRQLTLFVGDNFQHMHIEETAHNAVLWSRYTDAELVGIHGALLSSIPPDEMMYTLRWMVPYMNPAERASMLANMRIKAPPAVFAAVIDAVRSHLTQAEWSKLAHKLGLEAEAGLAHHPV